MAELFSGIDFTPVYNPLYALPIVAVIICAFLVYAFGFKSPGQPPSFDEIELEKKAPKKRKIKENQKKQQNGKASGALTKGSDSISSAQKKKSGKPAIEKTVAKTEKTEAKTKKASAGEKKSKASISQESAQLADEGNDDGWIHQMNKKGRKKRKKEDAIFNVDVPQSAGGPPETPLVEAKPGIEEKGTLEVTAGSEDKHSNANNVEGHTPEKVISKDGKGGSKTPAPKKQRGKKDNSSVESEKYEGNSTTSCDEKCSNDSGLPATLESESSESAPSEAVKAIQKKETKKKKKKQQQHEDVLGNDSMAKNNSEPLLPDMTAVNSNDVGLPATNSHENMNGHPSMKPSGVEASETVADVLKEDKKDEKDIDGDPSMKGSNVAFDELEGMYPDTKAQKRRKRVRREH